MTFALHKPKHLSFFLKSSFYWNVVDFQFCVVSCVQQSGSVICIHIFHIFTFLYSFPIDAITEYWIEFPVQYSSYLFYISNVYMSILVSQFICPSPCLVVTISLFSTSVTLFLFCRWVHLYFFLLLSTYKQYHMIFVFLCLSIFPLLVIPNCCLPFPSFLILSAFC